MIFAPKIDIQINRNDKLQTSIDNANKDIMNVKNAINEKIENQEVEKKTIGRHDRIINSPKFKRCLKLRRFIDAIVVRFLFLLVPSYQIYVLSCIYSEPLYYLLYSTYLIIILDCLWVLVKRDGRDYYWFSISFAVYTITMIIIIVFEMDFKYKADDINCETNRTVLTKIGCIESETEFPLCTAVEIGVVAFLASLVIGRWLLPQDERMDHHASYAQVYGFIILSADVVEIAQYMQNEDVAKSYMLMKSCQIVFGLSLIQFSFSLAAVKKRNMRLTGIRRIVDIIFSTESWSLILDIFSQELPCFIIRMILITSVLSNKEYSLYFFTLKNFLMILLMASRSFSLCWRKAQSERILQPVFN